MYIPMFVQVECAKSSYILFRRHSNTFCGRKRIDGTRQPHKKHCVVACGSSRKKGAEVQHQVNTQIENNKIAPLLVCPNCKNTSLICRNHRDIVCLNCRRVFFQDPRVGYLSLYVENGASRYRPLQQELFQSPITSFLYERGWRNNFQTMGYPLEKEVTLVTQYFQTYLKQPPDVLVDLSCGTGYITRKLAKTKRYSPIIAIDLSENMLKEAHRRMLQEERTKEGEVEPVTWIRADVSCLPLKDNVADVIYCGAALHCWPKVQDGLAEMYRILKPEGRVFATTFISNLPPFLSRWNAYRFFTKQELEWLFKSKGFRNVQVQVLRGPNVVQFVQSAIIRCCK